jgi:hypothetical protein
VMEVKERIKSKYTYCGVNEKNYMTEWLITRVELSKNTPIIKRIRKFADKPEGFREPQIK